MADEEKTEQATPKKLREAREKGQVAKSSELAGAIVLLGAVLFFYFDSNSIMSNIMLMMRHYYNLKPLNFDTANVLVLYKNVISILIKLLLPFMLVLLVLAILANVAQFGFIFTTKPLEFKLDKLNPINGLKNMFSIKSFGEMIKSILKIGIVLLVAYMVINNEILSSPMLIASPIRSSFDYLLWALWKLLLYLVLLILLLSILDFFFQRYVYMKNQRMSKFEVKQELEQIGKSYIGKPKFLDLEPELNEFSVIGEIMYIDDFGNIISNIQERLINNKLYTVKWGKINVSEWKVQCPSNAVYCL